MMEQHTDKFPVLIDKRKYLGMIILGLKLIAVFFRLWESSGYLFGFLASLGFAPFEIQQGDYGNQTESFLKYG